MSVILQKIIFVFFISLIYNLLCSETTFFFSDCHQAIVDKIKSHPFLLNILITPKYIYFVLFIYLFCHRWINQQTDQMNPYILYFFHGFIFSIISLISSVSSVFFPLYLSQHVQQVLTVWNVLPEAAVDLESVLDQTQQWSEVRGPSWALKHLRHSSSVRDVDQSTFTQGQHCSEQQSSRTQFHLKNHHTISFTWHNRAMLGMLELFGNRFVVLCLCHVGLIFWGDLVCESKFKLCFNRAVIYGSSCSSLHLSLGSWTFTRTILFEGIRFFWWDSWPQLTYCSHTCSS